MNRSSFAPPVASVVVLRDSRAAIANRRYGIAAFVTSVLFVLTARAEDWPHWLGPRRDSTWQDKALVAKFPAAGPKILWRAKVANGYSGPAVADGKVFVMDYQIASGQVTDNPGARSRVTGSERVLCFDAKSGKPVWEHSDEVTLNLSFPNGPRCTPAVANGVVYALGGEGLLTALKTADGNVLWQKDLKKEYQCNSPIWGFAAHPLVLGGRVFTLAGGKGSAVVALDAQTGKEIWRALDTADIGYAPPMMRTVDGKVELLVWHTEALAGLDPATGAVRWSQAFKPSYGMSIMAPRLDGERIFIGAFVNRSLCLTVKNNTPEVLWGGPGETKILGPKNSTPVVENGYLYGCDADGDLRCIDMKSGARVWSTRAVMGEKKTGSGTFFMARAPQYWILFTDAGDLILANLDPKAYTEISRAKILEPMTPSMGRKAIWSHPAFAAKCVFARNDKELVCVSLAE